MSLSVDFTTACYSFAQGRRKCRDGAVETAASCNLPFYWDICIHTCGRRLVMSYLLMVLIFAMGTSHF